MVLIEQIEMQNCRLCHSKPGLHELDADKKLIREIYECFRVKVNDKCMKLLPQSVCEECKKTIKNFSSFKQQIRKVDQCLRKILKNAETKSSKELFMCRECPAEFNNEEVFEKHEKSHIVGSSLKEEGCELNVCCSTCNGVFKQLEDYGDHNCSDVHDSVLQRDNFKDESDDDEAHKETISGSDQKSHIQIGDGNEESKNNPKYICNYKSCKKVLSTAYTLKTHLLKHQGKRSFLCVTCGKGFITKNSLTCHEKIHSEVKGYICKLCNLGFSVRSNLRAHEKKHHEGVRFYCSQCTKAFSSKCSLDRHERIHTGIRDFKCQSCPSAFYTKKELLKHQRYHQGLRLHKCDQCFKTFFERHHLVIHLRSHTGERPYVCTFLNCGKSFTESQKLKRHHNAKHAQMDLYK